ncbi:hypothetical protein [uncultured Aquimarina sp.]|uniref:tetratricopeptide repeat protein n=1 Tax=uncultured Aquimarina sp. TaxID=575652 RepID=UPI002634A7FC|nr:hypothetical protein [uncultured Aquimarina sp.]
MKKLIILYFFLILVIPLGCSTNENKITNWHEYSGFLKSLKSQDTTIKTSVEIEHNFWLTKMHKHPEQIPYLSRVAFTYTKLFKENGGVKNLVEAEGLLKIVNNKTHYKNVDFLRALAGIYMSKHQFKESLSMLQKADSLQKNKRSTNKMLFDVYMELGNFNAAKNKLDKLKYKEDFDFLVRIAKWVDHQGNLNDAIGYMKSASLLANKSKNKTLICWAYSALAEYYGHQGKIQLSYDYYLKALKKDPSYLYALKGIAWITFSYDKDVKSAKKIIETIYQIRPTPDLLLLKAEFAKFQGELSEKKQFISEYQKLLQNKGYAGMYNRHDILLFANDPKKAHKAIQIALQEIKNRPSPSSYDLLAWAYFNNDQPVEALKTFKIYVANKPSTPESEYHKAVLYKTFGLSKDYLAIKNKLLRENTFELGPNITKIITEL